MQNSPPTLLAGRRQCIICWRGASSTLTFHLSPSTSHLPPLTFHLSSSTSHLPPLTFHLPPPTS
ncbi:MAG: hypothetical protein J5654_05995, partial [Victivallales bacterium]|nr:hypothetical protein [Victivallales bacterium]